MHRAVGGPLAHEYLPTQRTRSSVTQEICKLMTTQTESLNFTIWLRNLQRASMWSARACSLEGWVV